MDNILEEDSVNDEQAHWTSSPPGTVHTSTAFSTDAADDDEPWFDGTFEWSYWHDSEWYTQLSWKMGPMSHFLR